VVFSLMPLGCGKGKGKPDATPSRATASAAAPVGVRHSCLVGEAGQRDFCREIHGDATDAVVIEAKETCNGIEGQLSQGTNPCPSDYVTRCIRRDLKETRYGYDAAKVAKDRSDCGGDAFSTR
ncbi:MAG: hypothetical protein FJ096_17405, partial [Deltaproteobacteria bacterium]|nr:hypothetical protein [Deltaproteobacteria bacterium]